MTTVLRYTAFTTNPSGGNPAGAIWSAFPHVVGPLEPGDMLFFNGGDHMGIYIGNGQFVHAPHTGDVVRIANLSERGDYMGAVRA